jgi:hypothetical protein
VTFTVTDPRHQLVRVILRRHARRLSDGQHVAHCQPTESEILQGFPSLGRVGKVIYDTRVKAANAAAELRQVDGRRQVPYECPRGDGHWHLQSYHHALGR